MSSNTTGVYREQVPCPLNSSHSFWPILFKLYRCFEDGLKICMWFIQNPEIIFYHFLHVLNLDIYRHSGSVVERPLCDREVAGSIPGRVIPKTLKMVLAALSLGAQH